MAPLTKPLKTSQLAERLAVDPSTARRWAADGRLPATRTPGGHYRIDPRVLSRLLPSLAA